ncbi:hypothetical protein PR202_ga18672 [Eleusine coracana subsp. coracana]|uniref:Secreted protein n=1 Tax=Eleusine coracana subsp. coracana TaxID=191504 RepID=A0AAV5CU52_ELECO|nr:hypothetical protein PR202_ga18672 [Eleusine coracana subsp. coracana]
MRSAILHLLLHASFCCTRSCHAALLVLKGGAAGTDGGGVAREGGVAGVDRGSGASSHGGGLARGGEAVGA